MALQSQALQATPRLAAYHEAGHAVAAYFRPLGGRTARISIRREDLAADDAGAHYCESDLPTDTAGEPAVTRAQVIVALAGLEVDRRLTGGELTCGAADYREVRDMLISSYLQGEIDAAVVAVTAEEAHRVGLDALAERSSERVARHFDRLLAALVSETRDLMEAKWAHVEAVAEALLARGSLDGDEVRRIIATVERRAPKRPSLPLSMPTIR